MHDHRRQRSTGRPRLQHLHDPARRRRRRPLTPPARRDAAPRRTRLRLAHAGLPVTLPSLAGLPLALFGLAGLSLALFGLAGLSLVLLAPARVGAADLETTRIYRARCAVCHGATGRGDGPAAGLLAPRPRDFTTGRHKFRSTASGTLPLSDDVERTIRVGLPGTSMPGYGDLLSAGAIAGLARLVLSFAPTDAVPGEPIALPPGAAEEPGDALYARAGCPECHGADGRGSAWRLPPAPPGARAPGQSPRPTDLTEPWTFRGGRALDDVARRILTGIDGSPMPAHAGALSAAEARAIAAHVLGLARRPLWEEEDPALIARAGVAADPWERGRYLVNAMLCPLCHTPIGADDGAYDTAKFLAGGMRVSAYPWGVWYSRNLTPDDETGLGRWSEADIVRALTRGIARDGRRLDPMAMPWPWFTRLDPADARAIAVYLKSLAPNANAVPTPRRPSLPEQVGGKLLALLGMPVAVEFWGGNAAADPALRGDPPTSRLLRTAAVAIGWSALAGLCALLVVGVLRRRRALAAVAGFALAAWVTLAVWPPLRLMSPETVARWLLMGTPPLPSSLGGAPRARAERGEYAATIAPCGLCHTPAGAFVGFYTSLTAAGGMRGRWKVYGTAVSSNLTPHADGVGPIGDAALLRAMRSGIGRDGRALHWQAMPWDIGSAWSLEDQRAMLTYFRALPPVPGRMPPPRPPGPGDPPADSFYFGDDARR